jgi:3,4-dihydroxy 2-butanone 4-phosphate synthase/GTP cyclohydrolase II
MKLDAWLRLTATARYAFARTVGLSPASITSLCNDTQAWV